MKIDDIEMSEEDSKLYQKYKNSNDTVDHLLQFNENLK